MYNESSQTHRCQSPQNDLINTPEHLRPGFSGGQPRQYNPREFGLTGNEEWQHPNMFRNMTYETDIEAMNTFRPAQPRRTEFCPPLAHNLGTLPEEHLGDMSPPTFDLSMPTMCDTETTPLGDNEPNLCVDSLYQDIVNRFDELRERIARGDDKLKSEVSHASCQPTSMPKGVSEVCTSQNKNGTQTTLRKVTTCRDQCGNVTSRVEETSTVSNGRMANQDCATNATNPGRQLNFSLEQSENLADVSMPSFHDDSMPAMSTRIAPQGMTSECLADTSAPPMSDSAERRIQTPARTIGNILAPSYGTNVCLEDVSAPSLAHSTITRPGCPAIQDICETSAPTLVSPNRGPMTNEGRTADSRRQECLDNVTMPSFGGVSGASNRQMTNMQSECLEDVSASFGRSMSPSRSTRRQQRSMPSQNICDITAPSFGSSGRGQTTNQGLEDMSMPSFGGVSGVSSVRTPTRQQRSMPSQNICDISAPSFGNSARGQMTNECLEDMTMPSFGGVSGASRARSPRRQQRSMPTQNICDTSAPFLESSERGPMTNECLENITMPSFGGILVSSRRQQMMPSECLENITQPSFGNSGPLQLSNECVDNVSMPTIGGNSKSSRRQQTMPSEYLDNVNPPTYASSPASQRQQDSFMGHQDTLNNTPYYASPGNMRSECLEDVSAPSFGRSMSSSRSTRRQEISMPSRNICDITAPSFGSSTRGQATNQCLEDITMPSFGAVSSVSKARSLRRQQRTIPTHNICDTSAPSFQSSGRGPMTNECLENMTMPSFGAVSGSSRRQQMMPSECLDDITQPSFGRSMPTQNMYEVCPPYENTSGRSMPQECLDNVTMPSYGVVSGVSNRQMTNMTNECLENVTAPSFGRCMSPSRSSRRHQRSMPSQNICNITAPSFGSSGRGQTTYQGLEDMSMPSFGGVSGVSSVRTPTRQQRSMPSQNICDISAPSFGNSARGQMPNECLEDMTMPSFGAVSGVSRARSPRRQQRSMPTQNICDTSAPSFQSTGRGPMTNECLENITMPSFGAVSGSSRRQLPMPSECLDDITQPSYGRSIPHEAGQRQQDMSMPSQNMYSTSSPYYGSPGYSTMTNECLENVTMPSFGGVSAPSNRQMTNMPNECLEDISAPSFGRSMSPSRATRRQQRSMPSQNICDITAPSFGSSSRGAATNPCLEDITMPSFGGVSGAVRARIPTRHRSMPSQNICDTSAPSFQSSGHRVMTNECLDNITMPSFPERSLSQGASLKRQQRSIPSRNICDISAPSYYSSGRGSMTNECLENMTMPTFGGVSGANSAWRGQTMPIECSGDVSAPSFERTQDLWDISPPDFDCYSSYPRRPHSEPTYPSECLDDVTAPGMNLSMSTRSPHMTRAYLNEVSIPSMRRAQSYPCIPSQEQIGDISAPSMNDTYVSIQDSRIVRRTAETSYPSEMLGNVSAPSYASNMSRQNRPVGLLWADRANISSMPSENLDNITEPTMFGNNTTRGYMSSSNRNRSEPQEQLDDVSMPTLASTGQGQRNNFARSTAIGDFVGGASNGIDSPFGTVQNNADSKDPPCQCPASKQSMKSADASNVGQDTNDMQGLDSQMSSTSLKNSTSNQNISRRVETTTPEQLINECEPSALNNTSQGPSSGVIEVKEVTIIASVNSMTRNYTKKNISENKDNTDRSRDRGQSVYHNVGNYENLNDISMPAYESTAITTPSPSNRNNNNNANMILANISEPTYGPSLQTTLESSYSNLSCSPGNNETYRGFSTMDNYAPFDQLMNSTPPQTGTGACSPLNTPEPVRGNSGQKAKSSSNTLRTNAATEIRNKCCCSNKNCQRNRKTRQNPKSQDRNAPC